MKYSLIIKIKTVDYNLVNPFKIKFKRLYSSEILFLKSSEIV